MKSALKLLVVAGLISLSFWAYPPSAAAFPVICPAGIKACDLTGQKCTTETVCCIAAIGLYPCPCVNGKYQCSL